jgi:DNA ligase (NAD+)
MGDLASVKEQGRGAVNMMYEKFAIVGTKVYLTDEDTSLSPDKDPDAELLQIPGYKKVAVKTVTGKKKKLDYQDVPAVLRPMIGKPANTGMVAALVGEKVSSVSPIPYLVKLVKDANKQYTKGSPKISDQLYDWAFGRLEELDPDNPVLAKIGSTPTKGTKVKLPFWLGSLNKLYGQVDEWTGRMAAVVVPKIDGISCLLVYKRGMLAAAYTRGNGQVGQLITGLVEASGAAPSKLTSEIDLAVRGELVIHGQDFQQHFAKAFANPRNLVAGLFNSKTADKRTLRVVRFYGHTVLAPTLSYRRGLAAAKAAGIKVVPMVDVALDDQTLSRQLATWRKKLPYDIDGLVIVKDREYRYNKSGNPTHSIAFKQNEEPQPATVTKVEWNISRHGFLKPTVIIRPIKLSGVTVERATGHNAQFIYKNEVGPGAVIRIVRSGDVIPYITSVDRPSRNGPQMPVKGTWKWNSTRVDAIGTKADGSPDQELQKFVHFFSALDVEGLRLGQLTALYDAGYQTIPRILGLTVDQLTRINRFGERSATVLVERLSGIKTDYPTLAYASGCFGRGLGRTLLNRIYQAFGSAAFRWKGWKKKDIIEQLSAKGITPVASRTFADGLPSFVSFANQLKGLIKIQQPQKVLQTGSKLKGMTIVFTGFRDKDLERAVEENGGSYRSTIPKAKELAKRTILVLKDKAAAGGTKAQTAKQLGVKMMVLPSFKSLLGS